MQWLLRQEASEQFSGTACNAGVEVHIEPDRLLNNTTRGFRYLIIKRSGLKDHYETRVLSI